MTTTVTIADSPERYGYISRVLHWGMAVVFAWQFLTAIIHILFEKTDIDKFFFGTHRASGTLLLALVVLRLLWALASSSRRPPEISAMARLGHILLYVLMFAIPIIALIRQYGSGKPFAPFGIPLMAGFDEANKIQWMIDLGHNFHGLLGWILLAAIAGHIGAVIRHYLRGDRYILQRMK